MRYYPESAKYAQAKRVLGEINLDLLHLGGTGPGKYKYMVKNGEARLGRDRGPTQDHRGLHRPGQWPEQHGHSCRETSIGSAR